MFLFILIFLSLTEATFGKEISQDAILPYNGKKEREFALSYGVKKLPVLLEYTTEKCTIHYIGAKHSFNIKSETHQVIKKEIEDFNPEFMILEGFENRGNLKFWENVVKQTDNVSRYAAFGEPIYAMYLATRKNTPFCSGEPFNKDIFKHLKDKGFSKDDIALYYVLRQIPQAYERKEVTPENLSFFINGFLQSIDELKGYDFKTCNILFKKLTKKSLSLEAVTERILRELFPELFQEINTFRDVSILKTLAEKSKKYKKILIIYGASHIYTQNEVLEELFGKPKIIDMDLLLGDNNKI